MRNPDVLYSMDSVPYHSPDASEVFKTDFSILPAVTAARASITERYENRLEGCPKPLVVFAGYSLGAWAVGEWVMHRIKTSPDIPSRPSIAGVVLIGDPQYRRVSRTGKKWEGMARHFWIFGYEPYPPDVLPADRWRTPCNWKDPICGRGYPSPDARKKQHDAARACKDLGDGCSHLLYHKDGKASEMGRWLSMRARQLL